MAALDGTATVTGDASAAERAEEPSTETTSPESAASEPAGFDFAAWVRTGDTDLDPIRDPAETDEEPVEPDRERPEPTPDASEPVEAAESTGSGVLDPVETTSRAAESVRPGAQSATSVLEVHPVKAATLALFLAFVALAVLSMVGYLPPLGPSTGLAF